MTMTAITRTIGASAGIAALAATVACGASGTTSVPAASSLASAPNGASPVMVTCEPNQRTLVRPVVVNGATMSQVECVSVAGAPVPVAQTTYAPANTVRTTPAAYDLEPARVVQPDQPASVARAIPARQVVYRDDVRDRDEVRARPKRTVAKSAVIIGTTAGASAGIGALIGGKKGALIGAAVGGGGATVWDQMTRRK
jgi:hypothetical protein